MEHGPEKELLEVGRPVRTMVLIIQVMALGAWAVARGLETSEWIKKKSEGKYDR